MHALHSELPHAFPSTCCLPLQVAVKIVETRIDNIKAATAQSLAAESGTAAASTSAAAAGSTAAEAVGPSAGAAETAGPPQQSKLPVAGEPLRPPNVALYLGYV